MGKREAQLGIAIGQKGVGKSYSTLQMIQNVLKGNPRTGAKPRKVLILDVNNEFGDVRNDQNKNFAHIRAIRLEDVKKWCYNGIIECRRVSILKEGGANMTLNETADALKSILDNFSNGLLLIEDITKFVSDSLPSDLIGAICTQRHRSCDIILHFQSVGKMAHPKLWANCNWLRIHKTEDSVKKHENKFGTDVTHLFLAEKLVEMKYKGTFEKGGAVGESGKADQRFYLFVDKDLKKVSGGFTKAMFQEAVEAYLLDNYNIVERELKKRNIRTGELIHKDRNKAVESIIQGYMTDYYGNR
jgi:hypothetical protein